MYMGILLWVLGGAAAAPKVINFLAVGNFRLLVRNSHNISVQKTLYFGKNVLIIFP